MKLLFSFFVGLLFGIGLIISGMGNPAKVKGFLDLAAPWDPSLIFVMGGAIAVGLVAFRLARKRQHSWLGDLIAWPTSLAIDSRLVIGSALFGIGWGMAGICPGPGLVLVGSGVLKGFVFVLAMLGGMVIYEIWKHLTHRAKADPARADGTASSNGRAEPSA